ncbi:MAG: DUF1834 family protein [Pyrinomonadaceae bacterium MAG19_C2-C3]|nr:DUF1834 family protein [Pyrinomonadaceae bacterium MAG19_C2-C3]
MSDVQQHLGFEFFIGGIEDAAMERLRLELLQGTATQGYVKTIQSYGGELDKDELREALDTLASSFPLMLVAYGAGKDRKDPSSAPLPDEPQTFIHDFGLTIVCCDNDARGESVRRRGANGRRGVYRMIDDARRLLLGKRFVAQTNDGEDVLLNLDAFKPAGVEMIARLPDMTAYAVHFDTSFKFDVMPEMEVISIEKINVDLDLAEKSSSARAERPGVFFN